MAQQVWNLKRKILGNVLPGILCVPSLIAGLLLFKIEDPFAQVPLGLMFISPVVGWFCVNVMGLYDNSTMRSEIGRKLDRELGAESRRQFFVGYSNPKFRSIWDPHEFVGFLIIEPDKWTLFGESEKLEILTKDILGISWKKNTHSAMLLGGFMKVDFRDAAGVKTLLIESREKNSLLANKKVTRSLVKEFSQQLAQKNDAGL